MNNKPKHDSFLINSVMRSLTENNRKLLRRLYLQKETGKKYTLTKQRREAIYEMERKAFLATKRCFDILQIPDEDYFAIARSILYSEDLLFLWREDWRTYSTRNDIMHENTKRNLKQYKSI